MTFDTQVMRSVFRKTSPLLFTVATFLFLSLMPVIPHQAYATDQECNDLLIEGLRTECVPFIDPATGTIDPNAQNLKCVDTVTCDPDNSADPQKKITKRCCVMPTAGSYGGKCFNPESTRSDLGVSNAAGTNFGNFQPSNCNVDEDSSSPGGERVWIVPQKRIPKDNDRGFIHEEQSLSELYNIHTPGSDWHPDWGQSIEGLPIIEEPIQVAYTPPFSKEIRIGMVWYYQVTPEGERRYFIEQLGPLKATLYINGIEVTDGHKLIQPRDPRANAGGFLEKIPCKIGNVIKKPVYSAVQTLMRWTTNSENMPDISLLCTKGTPQFDDPSKIGFDDKGKITGFDQTGCTCVDANSGPGIAAVLLCTRFVAGINDANAPWRLLIPAPENNGDGSNRFVPLLFGATSYTSSIEEFQSEIKRDIREFFTTSGEVEQWIRRILNTTWLHNDPNLNARFFGTRPDDTGDSIISDSNKLSAFKSNPFVRQYIGCLACAKYGGFPTAIGCLPMDRVDRFLAEGVLGIGVTFAGAFSILCIIFGAIQFQLSEGESAKVQKAQKLITQCIIGLLIIIFSIFLLRFVGVDLLRIYGLG